MPDTVKIEIFDRLDQVEGLRPIWEKLSSHLETNIDFYLRVIAIRPEFISPCILLARENGTPVALLIGRMEKFPLKLRLGYIPFPTLSVRRLVFACHGTANLEPAAAEALLIAISGYVESSRADLCLLSNLIHGSTLYATARRIPGMAMRDFGPRTMPCYRLQLPDSYEAFLQSLTRQKRYKFRHHIKLFTEKFQSAITYQLFSEPGEVDRCCAAAEHIASKSYQRKIGVGFSSNEETRRLIATAAEMGWLRAVFCHVDKIPIAFWLGYLYEGTYYCTMTGYDPAYRKYAVGIVLLLRNIEELCGLGVKALEFGAGHAQYKEEFGNVLRIEAEVTVYALTSRGFAANVLTTTTHHVNTMVKFLLARLGLLRKIKTGWRKRMERGLLQRKKTAPRDSA